MDEVDQCDLLLVIIGERYGSGITEAEYGRALKKPIPCFPFFAPAPEDEPYGADDRRELCRFTARLQRETTSALSPFRSATELVEQIANALMGWYMRKHGHHPNEDAGEVNMLLDR